MTKAALVGGLFHFLRFPRRRAHGEGGVARALFPLRGSCDSPPACRPSQARAMLATCPEIPTSERSKTFGQRANCKPRVSLCHLDLMRSFIAIPGFDPKRTDHAPFCAASGRGNLRPSCGA
jgi:hypothetical protein